MINTRRYEEYSIRCSACHIESDFTRFQMTNILGKHIDGFTYFEGRCLTTGFTKVESNGWLKNQWQRLIVAFAKHKSLVESSGSRADPSGSENYVALPDVSI